MGNELSVELMCYRCRPSRSQGISNEVIFKSKRDERLLTFLTYTVSGLNRRFGPNGVNTVNCKPKNSALPKSLFLLVSYRKELHVNWKEMVAQCCCKTLILLVAWCSEVLSNNGTQEVSFQEKLT